MGNWVAFADVDFSSFALTQEQGSATHVYAAFDPELKGETQSRKDLGS